MTKMLTPAEVAEILKISYATALDIIKYSGLPYIKIRRQYRISEEYLEDLLQQEDPIIIDTDEPA